MLLRTCLRAFPHTTGSRSAESRGNRKCRGVVQSHQLMGLGRDKQRPCSLVCCETPWAMLKKLLLRESPVGGIKLPGSPQGNLLICAPFIDSFTFPDYYCFLRPPIEKLLASKSSHWLWVAGTQMNDLSILSIHPPIHPPMLFRPLLGSSYYTHTGCRGGSQARTKLNKILFLPPGISQSAWNRQSSDGAVLKQTRDKLLYEHRGENS